MPRNEWDDNSTPLPSLDEMKYELLKKLTAPAKAIIEHTPGAGLSQAALAVGSDMFGQVAGIPYGIYQSIKNGTYGTQEGVREAQAAGEPVAQALRYTPASQQGRDILEGLGEAITAAKLPPYIGHQAPIRVSPDDVRVLAKRGIETGREIAAIPEDFLAAQQGLRRESNLGGTTYGAAMGDVARNVEDVTVGNYQRAKVRQAAQNAPEDTAYDPLRQRREQASVEVYNVPEGAVPYYAVKPTGGQLVKSVDPVTGNLREVENSSVAGISNVYENIRKPTDGPGLINQYLRSFVNRPGIENVWQDFNAKKVNEEFPGAPTPDQAREAFQVKYPTSKARNARMTTFFDEFSQLPEAQAAAAELGISIPTFEDYQKRVEAANTWAQKGLTNYVQKFVGTKEDPALQLATQGVTFKDPERLLENATTALNYSSPVALKAERKAAGFNEEGEIQPFLKEKMTELKAVDDQLREMVVRRNALYEQARQQNIDPAANPEYAELTNKLASKTAEKERITQQAENYKLGKAYETIADIAIEKRPVSELKKKLTFAEKQLFPYLDKTPEDAVLYDVDPTSLERLGLTDMATKFMDDIVAGKIPVEQIGNISIPKYIQEASAARMAKEAARKKDLAAQQKLFDNYLQEQVQSIPGDKIFGNAGVLEITNAMNEDAIRRHLSTDTEILDHCVGQGGRGDRGNQYVPIVDPVTGEVPKGSSGENTSYVRRILEKGTKIASFRDLVTGKPVGTLELNQNRDGKYDVGYASGYQNGRMQSTYSEALANYLNTISDQIAGSGDNLVKNGVLDKDNATRYEMRDITGLSDNDLKQLSFDGMQRFLTRDAIINLNNERKSMLPAAQLNSEAATLNTSYADLLDENQRLNFDLQNADDDLIREELMSRRGEIQSQLNDIGHRIGNMPIEELTNLARELMNDVFPENKTTARSRLQYLENESPISLRVQPRIYETLRELLRDERDAVGAPLSPMQQTGVRDTWYDLSNAIARSVNGDTYNAAAIANNIRRNPESYNLGEYNAQMINAIADMFEQRGIQDPALTSMPRIDRLQSNLPERVVEHINNMLGNAISATDRSNQNAIQLFRDAQFTVANPRPNTIYADLPQHLRNEAIGELQRGIEELTRRAQLPVLRNTAPTLEGVRNAVAERTRPNEQQQDLAVVVDRLHDAVAEDYGAEVGSYVRDALDTINYSVTEDPVLYIERVRQLAAQSDEVPVRVAFNMVADRLVEGVRANTAAARNTAVQLPAPAFTPPNTNVGNVVQNLINQYPEPTQIQALINDLEHGEYSELPTALLNADEIVIDDTVSQIIEQLTEYRNSVPLVRQEQPGLDLSIAESYQAFIDEVESAMAEGSFDVNDHTQEELAQMILEDQVGGEIGSLTPASRARLAEEVRRYGFDPYHDTEDPRVIDEEPRAALPAPEQQRLRDPRVRYATDVRAAFNGIRLDNDQFRAFESLDALRALPQLIRRPGATRNSLGIGQFSNEQANELATHFELLYQEKLREYARNENNRLTPPEPEGHKHGGSIQSSKNILLSPNTDEMRYALLKGK